MIFEHKRRETVSSLHLSLPQNATAIQIIRNELPDAVARPLGRRNLQPIVLPGRDSVRGRHSDVLCQVSHGLPINWIIVIIALPLFNFISTVVLTQLTLAFVYQV